MSFQVKNFSEFMNENRIFLSNAGTDGFGNVMNIHSKENNEKIGSIVFRKKTYLEKEGYPYVLELHIGFDENHQRQGFFQDVMIELLKKTKTPVFISTGRIINPHVFTAVSNLDRTQLDVHEIPQGFIITEPDAQ